MADWYVLAEKGRFFRFASKDGRVIAGPLEDWQPFGERPPDGWELQPAPRSVLALIPLGKTINPTECIAVYRMTDKGKVVAERLLTEVGLIG